jgi:hypothetical protein
MKDCDLDHRFSKKFEALPNDQGGAGRHRCAGCAYERGFEAGQKGLEQLDIDLESLPESQAGAVRHKSPHAAFALGYYDGIVESYRKR